MTSCWADKREFLEDLAKVAPSPELLAQIEETWEMNGTCLLESGHAGPHEWTPDDQIFVKFAPSNEVTP